jgi:DNA-damage-inducible protein J
MSKTSTVRARIEPGLKKEVEDLFHKLGLSTTEAINIFYCQVQMRQGLPGASTGWGREMVQTIYQNFH